MTTNHRRSTINTRRIRHTLNRFRHRRATTNTLNIRSRIRHRMLSRRTHIIHRQLLMRNIRGHITNTINNNTNTLHHTLTMIHNRTTRKTLMSTPILNTQRQRPMILRFSSHKGHLLTRMLSHILINRPIQTLSHIMRIRTPIILTRIHRHNQSTTLNHSHIQTNQRSLNRTNNNRTLNNRTRNHTRTNTTNTSSSRIMLIFNSKMNERQVPSLNR